MDDAHPGPPLLLPSRPEDAHKGSFGRALLIGGSRGMSGSIALSSMAALHCGSGLVSAAVPDCCLETVASFHAAIMTIPLPDDPRGQFALEAAAEIPRLLSTPKAVGCGPGMTTAPGSLRLVERILQTRGVARVLDADAINALPMIDWLSHSETLQRLVLTPHPGEFARLSGVAASDRNAQVAAAQQLAKQTGSVIVLKGGPAIVISPQEIWTNTTGNPGMATAGSGDLLTGVITSLLGQGLEPCDSAKLGVWIHGRAGDIGARQWGQPGLTAPAILSAIPQAAAEAVAG